MPKPKGQCCCKPAHGSMSDATDPLLPYIDPNWVIWEPAEGEGQLYRGLYRAGIAMMISILTGMTIIGTPMKMILTVMQWMMTPLL